MDPCVRSEMGNTMLHQLAVSDDKHYAHKTDIIINFFRNKTCEGTNDTNVRDFIEAKNELGKTALHLACESENLKVCVVLLENDASLTAKDKDGNTPLHLLALCVNPWPDGEDIEQCTECMADTRSRYTHKCVYKIAEKSQHGEYDFLNFAGQTPLHVAAKYGHTVMVNILLKHEAEVFSLDNNFRTALHLGVQN